MHTQSTLFWIVYFESKMEFILMKSRKCIAMYVSDQYVVAVETVLLATPVPVVKICRFRTCWLVVQGEI